MTAARSQPLFSPAQLDEINASLTGKSPKEVLEWAVDSIPRGDLWQTTAFGLTGLVTLDMISKISKERSVPHLVPLIFLDTLYHFPSTLDLANEASIKYSAPIHIYKPYDCNTVADFEALYGDKLWETDEATYDYVVKVEPGHRAYEELGVKAVLTGRRKSQGAERGSLKIVEVDETGLVKINPLADWTFKEVKDYVDAEGVPTNALLGQGYKSIGDWHSTAAPSASKDNSATDGDERAGRWAGRGNKTECGLHSDYFKMKAEFEAKKKEVSQTSAAIAAVASEAPVTLA